MKADQERVKNLLTDTVTLLCKNGLQFDRSLRVEGLLGVSIDDSDVFFVHISEKMGSDKSDSTDDTNIDEPLNYTPSIKSKKRKLNSVNRDNRDSPLPVSPPPHRPSPSPRRSPDHSSKGSSSVRVKMEPREEDVVCVKRERKDPPAPPDNEPRVPPLHGEEDNDVAQALKNLQGNFANQSQQMAVLFGEERNDSGIKQLDDSDGAEPFATSMVRNMHDPPGQVTPEGSQWNNSGLPPDLASQLAHNATSLPLDSPADSSIPGCSSWPVGPQGSSSQALSTEQLMIGSPKMTKANGDRQRIPCTVTGCPKSFLHRTHMYRHRKRCPHSPVGGMNSSLTSYRDSRYLLHGSHYSGHPVYPKGRSRGRGARKQAAMQALAAMFPQSDQPVVTAGDDEVFSGISAMRSGERNLNSGGHKMSVMLAQGGEYIMSATDPDGSVGELNVGKSSGNQNRDSSRVKMAVMLAQSGEYVMPGMLEDEPPNEPDGACVKTEEPDVKPSEPDVKPSEPE